MLRIELHDSGDILRLKIEGRFANTDAEHTRTLVWPLAAIQRGTDMTLVVDLTEVMFIDATGEEVLSFLAGLGARFLANTSYTLDVCDRLHLPLDGIGSSTQTARDTYGQKHQSGADGRRRQKKL